ncbi:8684_t:CDS:2, partial [Entrophospora sp. SA101]
MSEKWVHEYFNRRLSEWTIIGFLEKCDANLFTDMIRHYLTSLENITKNDIGNRCKKARELHDHYKQANCGTSIHLHHPTFKDSSLGIGMVNGGTFNTDLSPKQDQESDDDFQLVTPISQKRKKQLSLSKKDKKSNVLVKKAKTTNRNTDDDIDDPFISDNDLAESSEFLKDNSSSSNSFISASFDNKPQDLDSISPDPKESKEIRKLTQ